MKLESLIKDKILLSLLAFKLSSPPKVEFVALMHT
jgi:hypothetical protein